MVKKGLKFAAPVILRGRMKPIWEAVTPGQTGPSKMEPSEPPHENILVLSVVEGRVVLISHSRVNHHDIMLLVCSQIGHELPHFLKGEPFRIKGEDVSGILFACQNVVRGNMESPNM